MVVYKMHHAISKCFQNLFWIPVKQDVSCRRKQRLFNFHGFSDQMYNIYHI